MHLHSLAVIFPTAVLVLRQLRPQGDVVPIPYNLSRAGELVASHKMDDLATLDQSALPFALERDEVSCGDKATPILGAAGSSALKDWRHWPQNHPSYFPLFDSMQFEDMYRKCGRPKCPCCGQKTREILHISEYTAGGREIMNGKVNTLQLNKFLGDADKLHREPPSSEATDRPSFRLFFVCDDLLKESVSCDYMHRILAHLQTPPRFLLKKPGERVVCPLQITQGLWSSSLGDAEGHGSLLAEHGTASHDSLARTKMLYIMVQFDQFVLKHDLLCHLEYYSTPFGAYLRNFVKTASGVDLTSMLYICYSYDTRHCTILVAGNSTAFHHMRQFCASPKNTMGSDNPFVFVVGFLEQTLVSSQSLSDLDTRRLWADLHKFGSTSANTDNTEVIKSMHINIAVLPIKVEHMASISLTIERVKQEHKRFLETPGIRVAHDVALMVDERLDAQLQLAAQLQRSYSALSISYQRILDMFLGYAQIQNGVVTNKIAADNQKQAEATEALARDSRRDSEIMKRDSATMKTITVVTLVYLLATFVSTLLSMGMFDFGVGSGGDGRLQIARQGWIFLAISLPLTALTLGLAYLWKQSKERQWGREAAAERKDAKSAGTFPASPAPHWQENAPENASAAARAPAAPATAQASSSIKARISGFLHLRRRRPPPADLEAGTPSE